MKNTYYAIPDDIRTLIEDLRATHSMSDRPESVRLTERVDTALKLLDEVKIQNESEYGLIDILERYGSFADFYLDVDNRGYKIEISNPTIGYCAMWIYEIYRGGKIVDHKLSFSDKKYATQSAMCATLKLIIEGDKK